MSISPRLEKNYTAITAWLFIVLWVYAAASKIFDHETFVVQLGQSPLLTPVAGFVSWFVPLLEIVIAILLAGERTRLGGLYFSFCLIVLFSVYIFVITRYSSYVPCSCGGILGKMSWNQHLVFNVGFVALALGALIIQHKNIVATNRVNRKPV